MKPTLRFLAIAVSALVVGLAAGAVGGVALYERTYGNSAEISATQAANYAFMLKSHTAERDPKSDDAVVREVYTVASRSLVMAAMNYDDLDPHYRGIMERASHFLDQHPLALHEATGDLNAMFATEARRCIKVGGTAVTVHECVRGYVTGLLDNTCPGKNVPRPCAIPPAMPLTSLASGLPNSQTSR